MERHEIKDTIQYGKTAQLKKAVKFAVKNEIKEVGEDIHQAFAKTINHPNKWALQVELIRAMGSLGYKGVSDDLKKIIQKDKPTDMVTIAATTAYIRLTRTDINDVSLVIELLDKGISVVTGALMSLAIEPGFPDENSVNTILRKTMQINKHPQRIGREFGLIDPRLYVAIAVNYWHGEQKENFLNHCIQTAFNISQLGKELPNTNLKEVCENSLKGKPSKGYI